MYSKFYYCFNFLDHNLSHFMIITYFCHNSNRFTAGELLRCLPPPLPLSAVTLPFHHPHFIYFYCWTGDVKRDSPHHLCSSMFWLWWSTQLFIASKNSLFWDVFVRGKWNINRLWHNVPIRYYMHIWVWWKCVGFMRCWFCNRLNSFSSYDCVAYLRYYINQTNKSTFFCTQKHQSTTTYHYDIRFLCWPNNGIHWLMNVHISLQSPLNGMSDSEHEIKLMPYFPWRNEITGYAGLWIGYKRCIVCITIHHHQLN